MYHSVVKVKKNRGLEFFKIKPQSSICLYSSTKSNDICLQKVVIRMLNKNTWGVKKCEANQKQHASRQVQPKALISTEAKKLLYQKTFLTP